MSVTTISPQELAQRHTVNKQLRLIDVRTPAEFAEVHADFAQNIPLDQLAPATVTRGQNGSPDPLYFICLSGGRSTKACEKMQQAGFSNVVSVEGGTKAWDAAGLAVVRGKKAISLERQVRIAAGSLVFTGVALGWFLNPVFFGLSAFVGGGLVFAGITDTCGMGMLLARMPWNRGPACSA